MLLNFLPPPPKKKKKKEMEELFLTSCFLQACAVMVLHSSANCLLLFGGWTHPSLYPLHQSWRLFNELHQYDLGSNRWTHVLPASSLKPPAMAGHSATVHFETNMVVFGGLQKQRSNIGQFSSSNDVWCFNLVSKFI